MKNFIQILIFFSIVFIAESINAQQVFINEIMSSNGYTISDEDGDYSDWIELYNPQNTQMDLSGYGISDDSSNLFKWVFPAITLAPKDHLIVFASDKNRTEYIRHWETIIDWGDDWKYKLGTSEPPTSWKNIGFDDLLWTTGKSGFGYGDDDDSTIVPENTNSIYIRKVFSIDDINKIKKAFLHVDYDDGFVAYLNGVEVARANIGTIGIPPAYNESATNFTEPLMVYGGKPERFILQNLNNLIQNGDNVLAIQVHNYGTGSSDLTIIPFLTLGMETIPVNPRGPNPLLDLPSSFLHTNFKLSSEGETIVLTSAQSTVADLITFGGIGSDVSYGRQPDGSSSWFLFSEATPGDSNLTQGFTGTVDAPILSVSSGFYTAPVTISISPSSVTDNVYYTLDGSEPKETSLVYTTPIFIDSTKVLRVKSFSTGLLPSKTITNTFFINYSTTLTVVSLSTDPGNLFDEEFGIYALGDSAEPSFPYFGANFWNDWERPIHVELFETDGSKGFGIDMGVKIFGNWSRGNAQKSLALFARGKYGYSSLNYKLFDELPFTDYESFVLRNSGNDWLSTMMRDGLLTSLVDGADIDKGDYRPAVVFINGEYWGIHNIREKVNENFLAQHHNVNPDSIDILENFGEIVEGDNSDYFELYYFIENNDISIQANYDFIKSKMQIDNFIKYQVAEIYIDNQDWPGNNIKFWKTKSNSKWRWILYDTDFGFGIWNSYAYQNNTLAFALEPNGPSWPNPPWSTLILRKLLENASFKNDFINCFADYSNTIFNANVVLGKINSIASVISPEIINHANRWGQFNYSGWLNNVQVMRNFAAQRINYMRSHFLQKFNLTAVHQVNLAISDTSMGSIQLNSINIKSPTWAGTYFSGIPINIIANPKNGYRFVNWVGSSNSTNDSLVITLNNAIYLSAVFEIDSNFSDTQVVINEINYNSAASFNSEDWIELYNNGDSDVDISGWIFKDSDDAHVFTIPQNTLLHQNSYIVLCIDTTLFKPLFPDVNNYLGNVGFGLSGSGELIRLYDDEMNLVDSVAYEDAFPWPIEPDGNGPTLSLLNPNLDNSVGESWAASIGNGTPGKVNDIFVDVDEKLERIPTEYSLMQNYPNPFNPVTLIRFSLPERSLVTLKIYDVLGNEVVTLINEEKSAGNYEVEFSSIKNSRTISSGVYLYQLIANNFIQTKKMILIK